VKKIVKHRGKKLADLELLAASAERSSAPLEDLIVVAEFRDTIYPGLVSTGKVSRGGDKPCHTVINGENYHVLKALTWTHRGKVDAIYIDPPYNTGAKDWKYNNDYVEGDDLYRHSKWLAMMERRLLVAKELLNPADSVLIVTIDEKEYLRLGLLLEQVFPSESIQMVTTVIAPSGQPRGNQMSRVEEYIFLVYIGAVKAGPDTGAISDEQPESDEDNELIAVSWESLTRRGTDARRRDRENQFYPILIDPIQRRIVEVGEPFIPWSAPREGFQAPEGLEVVWPIRSDGSEGRWRISNIEARSRLSAGFLRLGRRNRQTGRWTVYFILRSDIARIDAGEIVVCGRADDG
jgi:adenine-specific DNA-methyltransferase